MSGLAHVTDHPRTLLGAALVVLSSVGDAHYKACAEFRLARYAEARAIWEALAELGNGRALFRLGLLAEDGLGEPQNRAKAESLYARAAQAGDSQARERLGMLAT